MSFVVGWSPTPLVGLRLVHHLHCTSTMTAKKAKKLPPLRAAVEDALLHDERDAKGSKRKPALHKASIIIEKRTENGDAELGIIMGNHPFGVLVRVRTALPTTPD